MDVKTAARVFDVFEVFAAAKTPLTVSDLATSMGVPQSSCFALVKTAERRGYMYSLRPRGPVYPTRRMLELTQTISAHDPVIEWLSGYLEALRDSTGETVVLGKQLGDKVVYLAVFPSRQAVRYETSVGEMREIYVNSIGRALLGMMDVEARAAQLAGLTYETFTPATITDRQTVDDLIENGARRGWHENLGESLVDLGAVAIGVKVGDQSFGVSVGGPVYRVRENKERIVAAIEATGRTIRSAAASDPILGNRSRVA